MRSVRLRALTGEIAALIALGVTFASVVAAAQGGAPAPAPAAEDASAPDSAPQLPLTDAGPDDAAPPVDEDAAPDAEPEAPDAAPPVPLAAPPPELKPVGFAFGLRAGYAIPYGSANGSSLSGVIPGAVHIGAELGYFLDPHFYLGGYFTFGFSVGDSTVGTACGDPEASCTATPIRFGAGARWHFLPNEKLDPWAGLGLGYEIVNITDQNSGQSASLNGFEAILQAGLDYKPKPFYGLGPFIESSLGHYSGGDSLFHGWFDMGLRVRMRL
jgi:hypothetical protein